MRSDDAKTQDNARLESFTILLLFAMGDTWLHRLMRFGGEQFSHIALMFHRDASFELGPKGLVTPRSLQEFEENYQRGIGIAELQMSRTCHELVRAKTSQMQLSMPKYSRAHCWLIAGSLLARKVTPRAVQPGVIATFLLVGRLIDAMSGRRIATCAGAVSDVLAEACANCWQGLPWPARETRRPFQQLTSPVHVLPREKPSSSTSTNSRRCLASPSDFWVSPSFIRRLFKAQGEEIALDSNDQRGPCLYEKPARELAA